MSGVEGSFSSPGYPLNYPHNKECIWNIRGAPGSSIQLTIHDFDVEHHTSCNFDTLEVGSGVVSPRITTLGISWSPHTFFPGASPVLFLDILRSIASLWIMLADIWD